MPEPLDLNAIDQLLRQLGRCLERALAELFPEIEAAFPPQAVARARYVLNRYAFSLGSAMPNGNIDEVLSDYIVQPLTAAWTESGLACPQLAILFRSLAGQLAPCSDEFLRDHHAAKYVNSIRDILARHGQRRIWTGRPKGQILFHHEREVRGLHRHFVHRNTAVLVASGNEAMPRLQRVFIYNLCYLCDAVDAPEAAAPAVIKRYAAWILPVLRSWRWPSETWPRSLQELYGLLRRVSRDLDPDLRRALEPFL